MASPNMAINGSYDYLQVALSVLIAISASYTALELAGRVAAKRHGRRFAWLFGGAVAMGTGIWSMHFVGMLAFQLPILISYDWPTVLLSAIVAIMASALALHEVSREHLQMTHAVISSALMGGGIAGMHYLGMAAMRLSAAMRFHLSLVVLSIVLAVAFSLGALLLAFDLREEGKRTVSKKVASALVMGIAVSAMHYTGMASATFTPININPNPRHAVSVSALGTIGIASVTLMLLGLTVFISSVDGTWKTRQKNSRVEWPHVLASLRF